MGRKARGKEGDGDATATATAAFISRKKGWLAEFLALPRTFPPLPQKVSGNSEDDGQQEENDDEHDDENLVVVDAVRVPVEVGPVVIVVVVSRRRAHVAELPDSALLFGLTHTRLVQH